MTIMYANEITSAPAIKVKTKSSYRLDLLAEIIDAGHAASSDESAFKTQVRSWSGELAAIPTRRLLDCFAIVKRNRAECEVPFDRMALMIDEMKIVGAKLR